MKAGIDETLKTPHDGGVNNSDKQDSAVANPASALCYHEMQYDKLSLAEQYG